MQTTPEARITVGNRVWKNHGQSWTRRDGIYIGTMLIGVIHLSSDDRQGKTTSVITGASRRGRSKDWCLEEFQSSITTIEVLAKAKRHNHSKWQLHTPAELQQCALA